MNDIETLIQLISKLPGLGPRSARRAALHLIKNKQTLMLPLAASIESTAESIVTCKVCGNVDTKSPCNICEDEKRDQKTLCVVEEVADLWALERSNMYKGKYHVLGGVLSAIDGVRAEDLHLSNLRGRCEGLEEVIIATNATALGQTTAHYITDLLEGLSLRITRLAQGVPIGGELDYLDEGTLGTALKSRRAM
ncbi:MAG: recombination protein RecR [Alphaproteobacteria bacterium CG11_big_fil_rev_8_21_14_0_20_44_7]|nr:MAG: recombination protein RecR [Alphaproteobacteria bacterium CG11_big_fil_rev_8_21_14_0_20_44_7]